MAEGDNNNSIVNFGDLSKPADTLIKKFSNAVGGIFRPFQIRRVAKAEAEAAIIEAKAQIKVTELQERAVRRFFEEEAKHQKNMEDIAGKAIPLLEESGKPDEIPDDWMANFLGKCRIISDNDMQDLWARLLAGESNHPGRFSRATVNLLADLDKKDAEQFRKLCGFGCAFGAVTLFVFSPHEEIYNKQDINFYTLSHLESIGLVKFNHVTGFQRNGLPQRFEIYYYGKPLPMHMPNEQANVLPIGQVMLTRAGQELAPICGSSPVDGFMEHLTQKLTAYIAKPEPTPPASMPSAAGTATTGVPVIQLSKESSTAVNTISTVRFES